jgi:hypothetical protein
MQMIVIHNYWTVPISAHQMQSTLNNPAIIQTNTLKIHLLNFHTYALLYDRRSFPNRLSPLSTSISNSQTQTHQYSEFDLLVREKKKIPQKKKKKKKEKKTNTIQSEKQKIAEKGKE